MGLPFASSSTNLSGYRMLRMSGSPISSIRTPQMTPVILLAFGCSLDHKRESRDSHARPRIAVVTPIANPEPAQCA